LALFRVFSCLPQADCLGLATVASVWLRLAGSCMRQLVLHKGMPLAPAAAIASQGFLHLKSVMVIGSADSASAFWSQVAALLERVEQRKPQLEKLVLRDLVFGVGVVKLSDVAVAQVRVFQLVMQLAHNSAVLRQFELAGVNLEAPVASQASLVRELTALLGASPPLPALTALTAADCDQALRCVRGAVFGPLGAQLERLDLSSGGLRTGGAVTLAQALPNMKCLKVLMLGNNGIGPEGTFALARGLEFVRETLEDLDLSGNGLGPEGLQILGGPLQQVQNLKALSLRGAWTSSEGVDALLELLRAIAPKIERLDLSQNRLGPDGVRQLLAALPDLPQLRTLKIGENYFATSEFCARRGANFEKIAVAAPALEELDLGGVGIGSCVFALTAIISALPRGLKELSLSSSKMQGAQMRHLVDAMPRMPELRTLRLVQAQMDDKAASSLEALAGKLPALRVLDIRGNILSKQAISVLEKGLRQMPSFQELRVSARRV